MYFSWVDGSGWVLLLGAFLVINVLRAWYAFAQRHVLTYTKKISALEDGDIVGELIVQRGDSIARESSWSFQTIIKAGLQRDVSGLLNMMRPSGTILADPRKAAGVYPEDIVVLQRLVKEGKLSDEIKVKASSPFVPAVLLAYVFLNTMGDGPLAGVWG